MACELLCRGVRLIYFHFDEGGHLFPLTVCAKSEREDLTPDDKRAWKKNVEAVVKEARKP